MTVLPNLAQQLAQLQAENAALKAKITASAKPKAITMKVSEKGGLSLYGIGRFPVTLYRGQWERILSVKDELLAFIEENAEHLSVKS